MRTISGTIDARAKVGTRAARWGMALALGLAVVAGGCSKEEEEDANCSSITFTAAVTSPADGDVYLDAPLNTCSNLFLNVLVDDLSGVYTASFDVTFPSSILSFSSCTVGPLLTKGSPATTPICVATINQNTPGRVTVALTRFNPDPSVTAGPSEVLAILAFQKIASGGGTIDFDTGGGGSEEIQDESSNVRPASFEPDHGGLVSIP